jgi:hypothetical protein
MPFDLFMNDTCPRCRKPIRLTIIEQHPTRADLSVHKFECADCGGVTTKTLFRKHGNRRLTGKDRLDGERRLPDSVPSDVRSTAGQSGPLHGITIDA